MKILLLAHADNPHTLKWVRGLHEAGHKIAVFTLAGCDADYYYENRIRVYSHKFDDSLRQKKSGKFEKLTYLKALPFLKQVISEFKPDIVHAHFATSYGLLGALTGFKRFMISVWGSDVYVFPKQSYLHSIAFKFILSRAKKVLSTSNVMAKEIKQYYKKEILITPFGIDLSQFKRDTIKTNKIKTIGIVKFVEDKYGIDILMDAFMILEKKYKDMQLQLLIVGGGSKLDEYKKIVRDRGFEDYIKFTGIVPYFEVSKYHEMLDIEVYPSYIESFGVAAIEAGAMSNPVVVANTGGLPEVVEHNATGFVLKKRDPEHIVAALERFIEFPELVGIMGRAGRARVEEYYNFEVNLQQMIGIYEDMLTKVK